MSHCFKENSVKLFAKMRAFCSLQTQPCSLIKFQIQRGLEKIGSPHIYLLTVIRPFHFCKRTLQLLSARTSTTHDFPCMIDCELSLFFFRFSKGSTRARERWAAKPRDLRNEGGRLSRLAPSVTRGVICVSRPFCLTDGKTKERLLVAHLHDR